MEIANLRITKKIRCFKRDSWLESGRNATVLVLLF
jgi:hypothetical protein